MIRPARHILLLVQLASILLCSPGGLFVHSLFQLRQQHIAHHHCENRFDPESKCNGTCFLKKRLDEAERHQHDDHATPAVALVVLVAVNVTPLDVRVPEAEPLAFVPLQRHGERPGHGRDIERPPRHG